MSRSLFDLLADAYDAGRPSYPDALYDAVEKLARPLADAEVIEVGAGTGIATRALTARGARVTAVDLGPVILTRLISHGAPPPGRLRGVVLADGHALPFRTGCADLVAYAQAFHWMHAADAGTEARRVLRPGGFLAVWWNDVAACDEQWWRDQQERLEAANPSYHRDYRGSAADIAPLADAGVADVRYAEARWTRAMSLDAYLIWLRSKTYVAALGDAERAFLEAERGSLSEAFPDGVVQEPFVTRLWVGQRVG